LPRGVSLDPDDLSLKSTNSQNENLLHLAIQNDQFDITKYLIEEKGFNIHQTNNKGNTFLHLATKHASPSLILYLLKEDVNILTKDNNGYTAYHYLSNNINFYTSMCEEMMFDYKKNELIFMGERGDIIKIFGSTEQLNKPGKTRISAL
jgi:ankyrin repeat protein